MIQPAAVAPTCKPQILLAPMEGLIDPLMRDVLTQAAPYDWCVTEFARVSGTVLPNKFFSRIAPELHTGAATAAGTPVRVQLLGSEPACMADNAYRLAALRPAGIDLNFGCPAPTVNRHRGGAVLLDEPELLYRIAHSVNRAIGKRVPFTAKMRLGVSDTGRAIEAAQALADGGAELLVVHARTKDDGYRPPAHWTWIARIAQACQCPVIANGEIWTRADYRRCLAESGQANVMLGRGAVADPFLANRLRTEDDGDGSPDYEADWVSLKCLIVHWWARVQQKLEARHAPGRLKQWLNLLRRHYPQAQALYERARPQQCPHALTELLMQA